MVRRRVIDSSFDPVRHTIRYQYLRAAPHRLLDGVKQLDFVSNCQHGPNDRPLVCSHFTPLHCRCRHGDSDPDNARVQNVVSQQRSTRRALQDGPLRDNAAVLVPTPFGYFSRHPNGEGLLQFREAALLFQQTAPGDPTDQPSSVGSVGTSGFADASVRTSNNTEEETEVP
ncbi:hypothetical protein EMCRGX_G010953 [Ephydatia muelleri]